MPTVVPASPPSADEFATHSVVALTRDVASNGRMLPAGALGTVVAGADGSDFRVQFKKPFAATVTLSGVDLTV